MDINVLYNEFVDPNELNSELEFMKESVALDRLLLAYDSICEKQKLDIMEAEIRCIEESGDMNVLEQYYREANEENGNVEKKKNIFARIWQAIRNMCRKIKEFFTGSSQKKAIEQAAKEGKSVGLTEEGKKVWDSLDEAVGICKGGPKKILEFIKKHTFGIIGLSIGSIAALFGGKVIVKRIRAEDIMSKGTEIMAVIDSVSNYEKQADQVLNGESEEDKKKFTQVISDLLNKLWEFLKKFNPFMKKDKNEDNKEKTEEGNNNTNDESAATDENKNSDKLDDKNKGQEKIEDKNTGNNNANELDNSKKDQQALETNDDIDKSLRKLKAIKDVSAVRKFVKSHANEIGLSNKKKNKIGTMGMGELKGLANQIVKKGIVFESVDDDINSIFGELFEESDNDIIDNDPFDFDLPDDMAIESTEDIEEISELLNSL